MAGRIADRIWRPPLTPANPRIRAEAVSLWQKMTAANSRAPLEFLSTHPAGENRIREIEKHLPAVMPLYEKARKPG